MLLEIAIGDAYGAGFEFAPLEKVARYNTVTQYHAHEWGIPAGHYTDDTQMSLAIAELILSGKEWNKENLAQQFVKCFKRDERLGYSKGFYHFLQSINTESEFIRHIKPNSTRNGAAMRSAPLGYLRDIPQLLKMANLQASLTHNTEIGKKSSQAIALAAHFFLFNLGKRQQLYEFVTEYSKHSWRNDWAGPVGCCGEETVNAVISVLEKSTSLKEVLINSVSFSGDVDTVAATSLGIASCSGEYRKDLPQFLYDNLENDEYGKNYLTKISQQLARLHQTNTLRPGI